MKKKEIKTLFVDLEQIIKFNVELYTFSYYYHNYVVFEPMDARQFEKRVLLMAQQIYIEFGQEKYLYALDKNSFVISASFQLETLGQIVWGSNNTSKILEIDNKILRSMQINSFMPKGIAQAHDKFLVEYLRSGQPFKLNSYSDSWFVTYSKTLFSCKMCVKLYLEHSELQLISYVKRSNDKIGTILNDWGEIDNFGTTFKTLSGIDYGFCSTFPHISLFFFMPQLMVFFLSHFYQLDSFELNGFPYNSFNHAYFMVFEDIQLTLHDISKRLKGNRDNRDKYISELFTTLKQLSFEKLEKVYMVSFEINQKKVQRNGDNLTYWELNIVEYEDVKSTFTQRQFEAQFSLLEKINFTDKLKNSIEKYAERKNQIKNSGYPLDTQNNRSRLRTQNNNDTQLLMEDEIEMSDSRAESKGGSIQSRRVESSRENSGSIHNIRQLSAGKDYKIPRRLSIRTPSRVVVPQVDEGFEQNKAKAIDIIKTLYTKTFVPASKEQEMRQTKRRWVDSINNYIQKRNSIINTIVEDHVGELKRGSSQEV